MNMYFIQESRLIAITTVADATVAPDALPTVRLLDTNGTMILQGVEGLGITPVLDSQENPILGNYWIVLNNSYWGQEGHDYYVIMDYGVSSVRYAKTVELISIISSGGDDPWATGLHGQYQVGSAGHMMEQIDSRVDYLYDRVYQVPGTGPVAVIPAPSEVTQTVAYAYCYDRNGAPQEGVTLTIQIATSETTGGGATYSRQLITAVSDETGLATVEIPRGSHLAFRARRGSGPWMQFAGVDAANVQIPYLVSHAAEIIET